MQNQGKATGRESLIPLIRDRLADLTPSERLLADIIMQSEEIVALSTAGELARMAGVSEASVSRFSGALGFARYSDMQAVARRAVMRLLHLGVPDRLDRSYEGAASFGEMLHTVVERDSENLWYTFRQAPPLLETLVQDLSEARRVYCLGARSASYPAGYLAFSINFMRSGVYSLCGDVGDGINALLDAEPGDVMVAFANARYVRDTTTLVKTASEGGLKVYLVSDSLACPSSQYTDRVIPLRCESVGIVPSLVSFFSLVNVLVAAVGVYLDRGEVGSRLEDLEDKYLRADYYHRFPSGETWCEGSLEEMDFEGEPATDVADRDTS